MTAGELLTSSRASLCELYAPEEARAIVLRLIEHCFALPTYKILAEPGLPLADDDKLHAFTAAMDSLLQGVPLQYVLGFSEFCGHRFKVGEGCLIPRPETEELVNMIIDDCSGLELGDEPFNILDMCTGSGCIAYSLAYAFPEAMVYGCDISQAALSIACRQRVKLSGARPVIFWADILCPPPAGLPKFDLIVSNPPYIREREKPLMHCNVLEHEPAEALFVPDDNPLIFYRAIMEWSSALLAPQGRIYLEVNESLADDVAALLSGSSDSRRTSVHTDFNGRPRFVVSRPF